MTSAKSKSAPAKGYGGHTEGSRKATVHEVFDKHGAEAAFTRGIKLKLSESTLHSWLATWRRAANPAKKSPAKKIAKPEPLTPVASPTQEAAPAPSQS